MKILSLDLATVTGWACVAPGEKPTHGTRSLTDCEDLGTFLRSYDDYLVRLFKRLKPDLVVVEQPILPKQRPGFAPPNFKTLLRLYNLFGHLLLHCKWEGLECKPIQASSYRSHFLPPPVPKRRDAIKAATIYQCEQLGMKPKDDNDADALALLSFAAAEAGVEIAWPNKITLF